MTATEKARETMQRNKEKREAMAQLGKRIKIAMIRGLLMVLEDEKTSPVQKLEASQILNELRKEVVF